jgi:hypothetical protein
MIAPKQIGWSQESNLLWEISRQLDRLNSQMCIGGCPTTTTTSTTLIICNSYTLNNLDDFDTTFSYLDCGGRLVEDIVISAFGTVDICAQAGSVNFNGEIIDNGLCI